MRVRVRSYDSTTRSNVSSGWVTTEVTKEAPAAPVIIVGGGSQTSTQSTGTGTTGTATPASAAGAVAGAVQTAVATAAGSVQTGLASTISDDDQPVWTERVGLQLGIARYPDRYPSRSVPTANRRPIRASSVSQSARAGSVSSDPAFLSAVEAADSAYESALDAAAATFKATVQPVLDNYKTVTAQAARDQKIELDRIKRQREADLLAAEATAQNMRQAGAASTAVAPDFTQRQTQLDTDLQAIDLQLMNDIMDLQYTLQDDVADVNANFNQQIQTLAATPLPDASDPAYPQAMMARMVALEQLNIAWVDAIQAKEAKFVKDSAERQHKRPRTRQRRTRSSKV